MKKLFTSLLLLMVGGMLLSTAQADELKINGKTVDLNSSGAITGTGITGTVKYNSGEKRLDLENATITASDGYIAITANVPGLRIYLTGTNTIKGSSDKVTMRFDANTTFCGFGLLNMSGKRMVAYNGCTVTFYACRVKHESTEDNAIKGDGNEKISIQYNGALWLKSKTKVIDGMSVEYKTGQLVSGSLTGAEAILGDYYGLKVAGIEVTPFNYDNITGTGISGTVKMYGRNSSTLVLDNATITSSNYGVHFLDTSKEFTIQLTGTNTINVGGYRGISGKNGTNCAPINITGTGKLTLKSSYGIIHKGDVNIKNCELDFASSLSCIYLEDYGKLTVDNATVHLKTTGSSSAAVEHIAAANYLNGCMETNPVDANYSSSLKGIANAAGSALVKEVKIEPTYGLLVCGIPVTKAMGTGTITLTGDGIVGTVKYVPNRNYLELYDGAKLGKIGRKQTQWGTVVVLPANAEIGATYSELTIWSKGSGTNIIDNSIGGSSAHAIYAENDVDIYGSAPMEINSTFGIDMKNKKFMVHLTNNFTTSCATTTSNYAIRNCSSLELYPEANSTYTYAFRGGSSSSNTFSNLAAVKLGSNCSLLSPTGAAFDSSAKTYKLNGSTLADKWLVFGNHLENFGLKVFGTAVTNVNYMDPKGNASFKYEPADKTLQVLLTYTNSSEFFVENTGVDGLVVYFPTSRTLSGKGGIKTAKDLTITGASGAKGVIMASGGTYSAIRAESGNPTITIKDVTLEVKGDWGITGLGTSATLNFNKANVTAESTSENGAVTYFNKINFTGCGIKTPAGAKLGKSIWNADGSEAKKVVISTSVPAAIDAVEVDNDANIRDIYDASGRQQPGARKGLNIIRMSDGTVKKVMVK